MVEGYWRFRRAFWCLRWASVCGWRAVVAGIGDMLWLRHEMFIYEWSLLTWWGMPGGVGRSCEV